MLEANAFLAMFTMQILAASVVYPALFVRSVRVQATSFPTERFAQLYPGVDFSRARERFLTQYRALHTGLAVLGLLLLGWMFSDTRRMEWYHGPVKDLAAVYFVVQALPNYLVAWLGVRAGKVLRRSFPEEKRRAVLQRRGLFDFVSPFVVSLAVLGYFLFVALAIHVEQNPFPGFRGALFKIGGVTLVYAMCAVAVYVMLYGRKINPLETHAARVHTMGLTVQVLVYSCIAVVVFVSLDLALGLLDLNEWEPFALSTFFVAITLLSFIGLTALPRQPEAAGLGPVAETARKAR
jgi:hypothetical protein